MESSRLVAWHGQQTTKDFYVARVRQHMLGDEIIQGVYWEDGRGCGVGCSVHSSDHSLYETDLGIPVQLAYLEDSLFEGMSN